jgi:hypothetical protein
LYIAYIVLYIAYIVLYIAYIVLYIVYIYYKEKTPHIRGVCIVYYI